MPYVLLCPRPDRRGIQRWCCLTSVCLSHTLGLSREQRGLDWHRDSPRHTWLGHHFQCQKVKGQGHQAALLTAVLTRQPAAALSVWTYWPWETTATLRLLGDARRFSAHRGRRGTGHIVAAASLQLVVFRFIHWFKWKFLFHHINGSTIIFFQFIIFKQFEIILQ